MRKLLFPCIYRDGGPLPDGVEVSERSITVRAPVELLHGGLYECVASYHHMEAALKFNITVRPRVTRLGMPGSFSRSFFHFYDDIIKKFYVCDTLTRELAPSVPPSIAVDVRPEDGRWLLECSAAGPLPAANVSWLLPQGVSAASRFSSTSGNGSHSVLGAVLLPACPPWELTALCVINHPAFEAPHNRTVTLPMCGTYCG